MRVSSIKIPFEWEIEFKTEKHNANEKIENNKTEDRFG